jgi:hypothetical protein
MKTKLSIAIGIIVSSLWIAPLLSAQKANEAPLRLVQTIPLPNVKGRIDHMFVDEKRLRLFVAGLENGSLEVVDLRAGQWSRSIPGFKKPQGIWYIAPLNKLFVASGDDGMLRVFNSESLELIKALPLDLGANRVVYDARNALLYVGVGGKDAGKDYGEVAIVDANRNEHVADIKVSAHPAELLLDATGRKLFSFVPGKNQIQVIDTRQRVVIATWPVSSERPGDGAYDEPTHRIFIGTRNPPEMIVMDSTTGKEVAALPTVPAMDGVYFDASHKRVYVSGGRGLEDGSVFVYQQKDADHYEMSSKVTTLPGAGTSLWVPELNRYYVAAPSTASKPAAILVFETSP